MPETVGNTAKLVVYNFQYTPKDQFSDIQAFAKTDDLMVRVMSKLGIPRPRFILRRRLMNRMGAGCDLNIPFVIDFRTFPGPGAQLKLELESMGHHGEPDFEVESN
ncbi:hypothetical protein F5Y03DRAFT_401972 [Xylaria venustula]|nr:hypothetical protein F5Y03DRAFT_401972 [Xylaria venustula]